MENTLTSLRGNGNTFQTVPKGNAAKILTNRSDQSTFPQEKYELFNAQDKSANALQVDGSTTSQQRKLSAGQPNGTCNKPDGSLARTYTLLNAEVQDSQFIQRWIDMYERHITILHSLVSLQLTKNETVDSLMAYSPISELVQQVEQLMKNIVEFTANMNHNAKQAVGQAMLGWAQCSASPRVGLLLRELRSVLPPVEHMLTRAVNYLGDTPAGS